VRIPGWLGRTVFGGETVGAGTRQTARVLGVLAILGLSLVLTSAADASPMSFTWTGRSTITEDWSAPANWVGDASTPEAGETIGTLTFPRLTNEVCEDNLGTEPCYISYNNVSGLSAESVSIDDANDYEIGGDELTLGGGGLTATPEATGSAGDIIDMPLRLSESQKWSIANRSGGTIGENGLLLGGKITGSSALTTELNNGSALILDNDTEVGPVTIEGPVATGEHIKENGSVFLEDSELNSGDGQTVDLRQIFFTGTGAVGALRTDDATLDIGSETEPAEGLEAASVKLDSASGVVFQIVGSGTAAQIDYSQLVAKGPVELAGVITVVVGKSSAKAPCPVLTPGETFTFLSTTGTLSDSFSDAPEDGLELPIGFTESCKHASQTMRISYNRSGATETVIGTVEAGVKEKQEQEQEAREKETKEKEEALKKLVEEHVKQVGEEAATKEATKKHEEEAAAVSVKKHQEEEVAINHQHEAEATAKKKEEAATKNGVLGAKEESKAKPLTRVQLLAKALKQCKKQPKKKRAQCEAAAKKRYGGKGKGKRGKK
jgi:hypothetical protein